MDSLRWKTAATERTKLAFWPLLQKINKVRENTRPPQRPLTQDEFEEIYRELDALDRLLVGAFGSDYRLVVYGNGQKVWG